MVSVISLDLAVLGDKIIKNTPFKLIQSSKCATPTYNSQYILI